MPDLPEEPRNLTPFKIIQRGEDTLSSDEDVVFADFSPRVVPADTPDEEDEDIVLPKEESALEPAPSLESTQPPEPNTLETPVPAPVETEDGKPSPNESSSQSSSSDQKSG